MRASRPEPTVAVVVHTKHRSDPLGLQCTQQIAEGRLKSGRLEVGRMNLHEQCAGRAPRAADTESPRSAELPAGSFRRAALEADGARPKATPTTSWTTPW